MTARTMRTLPESQWLPLGVWLAPRTLNEATRNVPVIRRSRAAAVADMADVADVAPSWWAEAEALEA